jgi:hypothetical protein
MQHTILDSETIIDIFEHTLSTQIKQNRYIQHTVGTDL